MTRALLSTYQGIPLRYANRHGLITGKTGSGKTVSLMRLVEQFAQAGVPCLVTDIKGDIAALSRTNKANFPDITVSFQDMGADLTSRALNLTDTQSACLEIAFHYASATKQRLATIADMRDILAQLKQGRADSLGTVSNTSIGIIQRALLRLESQNGNKLFQVKTFDVASLLDPSTISILKSDSIIQNPKTYSALLLWFLSELWQRLPEIGDTDKPRLVLFFDESHLLFSDMPAALLQAIENTIRLIRSKGVGVYFVSQSPNDLPAIIQQQASHKINQTGIGFASLETLDSMGKPAKFEKVRVTLPDCPLGALAESELPETTKQADSDSWQAMGKAEFALLLGIIAAIPALGFGLWAIGGKALLFVAAAVIMALFKR